MHKWIHDLYVCMCARTYVLYVCMHARDISLWAPCQRMCLLRCDVDLLMIFAASGTKCTSTQKKTAAWLSYWTEVGAMILRSVRQIWSFQFNLFSFPPLALRSFCASLLFGTWQVNATSGYEPKNISPMEWPKLGILVQMWVQLRNCFTNSIDVKLGKGALFQEFKATAYQTFASAECRSRKNPDT